MKAAFVVSWMLIAAVLPAGAEWDKLESRTAAYVICNLSEVCSWGIGSDDDPIDLDPFADDGELERAENSPLRLSKPPRACRHFREGDELWDVTALLLEAKVLGPGGSWAVVNETTGRLILSGVELEHQRFVRLRDVHFTQFELIETKMRLLKVRSSEVGRVSWTEALVRERLVESHSELAVVTRPGVKGSAGMTAGGGRSTLETEAHLWGEDDLIDLRLLYNSRRNEEEPVTVHVATALMLFSGSPLYLDVGSISDPEHSLLLEVRAELQFIDGTPLARWREYEKPEDEPKDSDKLLGHDYPVIFLGGGITQRTWLAPPTLLSDLGLGENLNDPDPFGGTVKWLDEIKNEFPVFKSPDRVIGYVAGDVLIDLSDTMRQNGIDFPQDGWVAFDPKKSIVLAKVDAASHDQLDSCLAGMDTPAPPMISLSVSLIEWDGAEVAPGKIPNGAQRLKKIEVISRTGQKVSLLHGTEEEKTEALQEGMRITVEPNVGATDNIIDLRMKFESSGKTGVALETGITLEAGKPIVLGLGRSLGRSIGAVIEARVHPIPND